MSRRLGERSDYSRYKKTLGRAVHYDAHLLMLYLEEPGFRFDGLGSSWLVQMGRYQERSGLYPPDGQLSEMDAQERRRRELRRLLDAIERLREFDPQLHHAVFAVCMVGGASLRSGRGTRHESEVWARVLKDVYGGDDRRLTRHLQRGWDFVAVLAVVPAVLRAAQEAGAVDERAVAWARERGLL